MVLIGTYQVPVAERGGRIERERERWVIGSVEWRPKVMFTVQGKHDRPEGRARRHVPVRGRI